MGLLKTRCFAVAALVAMSAGPAFAAPPRADGTADGITRPSATIKQSFPNPGLVREVFVKSGDLIEKGKPLAQQDDKREKLNYEFLRIGAESTAPIDAAKAKQDLADAKLKRTERMFKEKVETQENVELARLEAIQMALEVKAAEVDRAQKKARADEQLARIEEMKLLAVDTAVVQKVEVEPGEVTVADPTKPSVILVKNDPLWVELHLPVAHADRLEKEQELSVWYKNDKENQLKAKVIFKDPVVDPSVIGGSQLVRLELANPKQRTSGRDVVVQLPTAEPTKTAGADVKR